MGVPELYEGVQKRVNGVCGSIRIQMKDHKGGLAWQAACRWVWQMKLPALVDRVVSGNEAVAEGCSG